jgi:hypothetical protein
MQSQNQHTARKDLRAGVQVWEAFLERYGPAAGAEGPVCMVREVFGVDPDPWQADVLRDFGRGERRISIRSCHGPGKTAVAAWVIINQVLCRFPQKTGCTAPTSSQLFDALFAEVKGWISQLPEPIQALLIIKADHIELAANPAQSFVSFKTARAETPEAIAGLHAPWVLIVVDEASGVYEAIFESAIGSMSEAHATTLLLGNPVRTSGTFFDSHHKMRERWRTYHIHGLKSHPTGTYSARVTPEFVEDVAARYGRESNAFRVRVLGEFPRSDLDTIVPYELADSAMEREIKPNPYAPVVWGLDVAWRGDDLSALCKRQDRVVLEPIRVWHNLEAMQLVGAVKAEYDILPADRRPAAINVDAINYGAAIASRLSELGLPARAINVAESPAMTGDRYLNLRTELWYMTRDWLSRRDCMLPRDEELLQDLVAAKYLIVESTGKLQVEPKKKAKARGERSPDRADALILTFADAASIGMGLGSGLAFGRRAAFKRDIQGVV